MSTCVRVYVTYVWVPTEARRRYQALVELELQVVVAYLNRVLGKNSVPL